MKSTKQQILDQALQLSDDDRADLIARLQSSIHPRMSDEIRKAWAEESERRVDQLDADDSVSVEGEPVLDRMQRGQRP